MYQVEERVLNATLQYLATRPFQEVAELIAVLRQSKKVEAPKGESEVKDKPATTK